MAPDDARITPYKIPEKTETIELLTGGEVFFQVDGVLKTFAKGTLFWHRAGEETIWRTTPQAPYRCAVFHFRVADRRRPAARVSVWNSDADLDGFVAECLNLFHTQRLDMDVLTFYIYSTLLRHALANDGSSNVRGYPKPLDRSLDYIHHNLADKYSIATLAKHSQISPPQLFKLFKTHLKTTPHQYILSRQLAKARTLLAGTQRTIKEIAFDCGFESLEVFYRRFHRESKMPPGEYRRKYFPYPFSKTMDQ
jgi:AraC-like DNA-binding protein